MLRSPKLHLVALLLTCTTSELSAQSYLHIDVLGYRDSAPPMAPYTAHVSIKEFGDFYDDPEMNQSPAFGSNQIMTRAPGCARYPQLPKQHPDYQSTSTRLDGVIGSFTDPDVEARLQCLYRVRQRFMNRIRPLLGDTDPQEARIVWTFEAPKNRRVYYYEHLANSSPTSQAPLYKYRESSLTYQKGIMEGLNAAHVFEKEGVYTIQVSVVNSKGQPILVKNRKITILENKRRTIYVSNSGSDSNSGRSLSRPVKSMARAQQLLDHNTQILLQCGSRFTMSEDFDVKSYVNVLIGAYTPTGTCETKPQLVTERDANRKALVVHYFTSDAHPSLPNNLMIQDLTIGQRADESIGGSGASPFAFRPRGTAHTFRRITLAEVSMGLNTNAEPRGVFFTENSSTSDRSIRQYPVYNAGRQLTVAFNYLHNSIHEHTIRISGMASLTTIYKNVLTNRYLAAGEVNKCALNIQSSSLNSIIGNLTSIDQNGTGCSFIGPLPREPWGDGRGGELTMITRIDRNHFREVIHNSHQAALRIGHGAIDTLVSSNIFEARRAIHVVIKDSTTNRKVENLKVLYNTHVNTLWSKYAGRFFEQYEWGENVTTLFNLSYNLRIDPGTDGRTHPNNPRLGQTNVFVITRSADWDSSRFAPAATSPAISLGIPLYGVHRDFKNRPRTFQRDRWTVGAIER